MDLDGQKTLKNRVFWAFGGLKIFFFSKKRFFSLNPYIKRKFLINNILGSPPPFGYGLRAIGKVQCAYSLIAVFPENLY